MPVVASTSRLEAFSDGVIAVIITIMVLELKVPHQNGLAGLEAILPVLLVYLLSFAFTAIYWINHHHIVSRIDDLTPPILYANIGFLFTLSLLPFFTSWVLEKQMDSFSVILYAVCLLSIGLGFFLLRRAIDCHLKNQGRFKEESAAEQRKHIASLALYVLALPLALRYPRIALSVMALVTVIWIIPTAPVKPIIQQRRSAEPVPSQATRTTD